MKYIVLFILFIIYWISTTPTMIITGAYSLFFWDIEYFVLNFVYYEEIWKKFFKTPQS